MMRCGKLQRHISLNTKFVYYLLAHKEKTRDIAPELYYSILY